MIEQLHFLAKKTEEECDARKILRPAGQYLGTCVRGLEDGIGEDVSQHLPNINLSADLDFIHLHTYSYSCRHNNTSTKHLQLQLCCQATAHTQEIKHPNPTTKRKLEGFGCPYSNLSVSSFYSLWCWCLNSCQSSPLRKHNKEQCLERCQTDIELVAPCGMHLPLRAGEQVTRQCFTRSKKSCQTTTSITSLALNITKPSFHRSIE